MLHFPGSSFVHLKLKLKPKASKLITTLKWMHWAPATTRQFSSALLSVWARYGEGARCSVFCAQCWVFSSQALHLPHSRITFALSCRALIIIKSNQPDSSVPAPLSPFILDSFINAIERHLQRCQPQVGSKWAHAATDMKAKEGEEWGAPLLNRQSNQTRCHTTQVVRPTQPSQVNR